MAENIESPRQAVRTVRSNRRIDSLIVQGNWHIERQFALRELGAYLNDLEALEQGVPFEKLDFRQRLESRKMQIWNLQSATQVILEDNWIPSESNTPAGSFALLNLSGTMTVEGGWCNYGARDYETMIRQANANRNIEGILIRGNTGGGQTLAGQVLLNAIRDSRKAVVVYAEFLASAGVHGTLAADEIIAAGEQSMIGSIGTYASLPKKMIAWYNENYEDIYAEQSPDKNKAVRDYFAGDKSAIQISVNQAADLFQKDVMQYRNLKGDVNRTLAGGLFYAREAKSLGLVDGIGTFNYAIERLAANVQRRKRA